MGIKEVLTSVGFLLIISSCQKNSEDNTPINIPPEYVPPVNKITYTNTGAFYFGFGFSGSFRFSTGAQNGTLRIFITHYEYWAPGGAPDSTRYTYKYDEGFRLQEIERTRFSDNSKVALKLYYSGPDLTHFEEWEGGTLYKNYSITNDATPTGRRLAINPYTITVGTSGRDTLSHILQFNASGKPVSIFERRRTTGGFNALAKNSFVINYNNEDISSKQGYTTYLDYSTNRVDSLVTSKIYTRMAGEDPVLTNYLRVIYGSDLYDILNLFEMLPFNSSPSQIIDFLILPGQRKRSEINYTVSTSVYTNGIFSHTQGLNQLSENTLDASGRLIKCKRYSPTPPNYYIWEVEYN